MCACYEGRGVMEKIRARRSSEQLVAEPGYRRASVAELGGPNPSPIERIVVEQATIWWLQSHYADTMHAKNTKAEQVQPSVESWRDSKRSVKNGGPPASSS